MDLDTSIRLIGFLLSMPGIFTIRVLRDRVQRLRETVWEPTDSIVVGGSRASVTLVPHVPRLNREMAMSLAIPLGVLLVAVGMRGVEGQAPTLVAIALVSTPFAVADAMRTHCRKSPPIVFTITAESVTDHRTGHSIAVADLIRVTRHRPLASRANSVRFQAAREAIAVDLWRTRLPGHPRVGVEETIRTILRPLSRNEDESPDSAENS